MFLKALSTSLFTAATLWLFSMSRLALLISSLSVPYVAITYHHAYLNY